MPREGLRTELPSTYSEGGGLVLAHTTDLRRPFLCQPCPARQLLSASEIPRERRITVGLSPLNLLREAEKTQGASETANSSCCFPSCMWLGVAAGEGTGCHLCSSTCTFPPLGVTWCLCLLHERQHQTPTRLCGLLILGLTSQPSPALQSQAWSWCNPNTISLLSCHSVLNTISLEAATPF